MEFPFNVVNFRLSVNDYALSFWATALGGFRVLVDELFEF
jgi:hypothetical protein